MTSAQEPRADATSTTVSAVLWSYAASYLSKFVILISTGVLARLLSPSDFGAAAYAFVVIGFLEVVRDLGIGPALIYRKDDPQAADTAFWLGLAFASVLCVGTVLGAPLAGDLFNDDRAVGVVRVLGLYFPLIALSNVHDALLMKGLLFRRRLVADMGQALSKGGGSIVFALLGLGAWSLICGQLLGAMGAAIACWSVLRWRPRWRWDWAEARGLLSYGSATVSLNTVARFLVNADYLFIGRSLGSGALGVYTLAFRIPELFILELCGAITRVLFPVYSQKRDDPDACRRGFLLTTRYVTLVTVPLGVGLMIAAEPLVLTLFGDEWTGAVPVLRGIAVFATLQSLLYNVGDVYKAQGRMHLMTGLAVAQALVLLPALWWAATSLRSITAVAWTHACVALLTALVQTWVATRTLGVRPALMARAVTPALSGAVGLAAVAQGALTLLPQVPPTAELMTCCAAGAVGYFATLRVLHHEVLLEVQGLLRSARQDRLV